MGVAGAPSRHRVAQSSRNPTASPGSVPTTATHSASLPWRDRPPQRGHVGVCVARTWPTARSDRLFGTGALGFDLAAAGTPGTFVGWQISTDLPERFVLDADGRLMQGRMVFAVSPTVVTWTTMLTFHRRSGSRIWSVAAHVHRALARKLLGRAAASLERDTSSGFPLAADLWVWSSRWFGAKGCRPSVPAVRRRFLGLFSPLQQQCLFALVVGQRCCDAERRGCVGVTPCPVEQVGSHTGQQV